MADKTFKQMTKEINIFAKNTIGLKGKLDININGGNDGIEHISVYSRKRCINPVITLAKPKKTKAVSKTKTKRK